MSLQSMNITEVEELVGLDLIMVVTTKNTSCKMCSHFGWRKYSNILEHLLPAYLRCKMEVVACSEMLVNLYLELHTATTQKTVSFLKVTWYIMTWVTQLKNIWSIHFFNNIISLFPVSVTNSIGNSPTNILHSIKLSSVTVPAVSLQ